MEDLHDHEYSEELRERLNNLTCVPDDAIVWGNLKKKLDRNRKKRFIYKRSVLTILCLGMLWMIYTITFPEDITQISNQIQSENASTASRINGNSDYNEDLPAKDNPKCEIVNTGKEDISRKQNVERAAAEKSIVSMDHFTQELRDPTSALKQNHIDAIATTRKPIKSLRLEKKNRKYPIRPFSTQERTPSYYLPKRQKQFGSYLIVTPCLNYVFLSPNRNDLENILNIQSDKTFSVNRMGVALEAGGRMRILPRLEVSSGMIYYFQNMTVRYDYTTAINTLTAGNAPNEYYLEVVPSKTLTKSVDYKIENLGAKTSLHYKLKGGVLEEKIGAGLQYQYGIKGGSSSFLGQLLYDIQFHAGDHFTYFTQLSFTKSLMPQASPDSDSKVEFRRAGIGLGILWKW